MQRHRDGLDMAEGLADKLGQDGNFAWTASGRTMLPFTG